MIYEPSLNNLYRLLTEADDLCYIAMYYFIVFAFVLLAWCTSTQEVIEKETPTTWEIIALQNAEVEKELWLTWVVVSSWIVECKKTTTYRFYYKFNDLANSLYKSYTNAPRFCFAFRLTIDWVYYWYINVYRNANGGVSNDPKHWLEWCVPWKDVNKDLIKWYVYDRSFFDLIEWETYKFAKNDWYWYEHKTIPFWIKELEVKDSWVKEWVDLFDITFLQVSSNVCE